MTQTGFDRVLPSTTETSIVDITLEFFFNPYIVATNGIEAETQSVQSETT